MKRLITTLIILAVAMPLFAETRKPRTRTIVVRDGKVIKDGEVFHFDGELFGGKRAYIGVNVLDITDDLRQHYGAPKDSGVLVGRLEANGPADKAGIKVGDIILSVDGEDVSSQSELRAALREKKEGDAARVDVLRGKSRQTFVITVGEKELPTLLGGMNFDEVRRGVGDIIGSPEWRARIESTHDCDELQTKLKELETRMKDLEKKLQK